MLSLWYYNAEGFTQLEQLLIERLLINRSMETSLCRRSFCHGGACVIRFPNKEIGAFVLPNSFCLVYHGTELHSTIPQDKILLYSKVRQVILKEQLCYCFKAFGIVISITYFGTWEFHWFK